jgi:hypothetical protein
MPTHPTRPAHDDADHADHAGHGHHAEETDHPEHSDAVDHDDPDAPGLVARGARGAVEGARSAAEGARDVAGEIATRLPDAAASTRVVVGQANVQMQASSNETLIAGTSLSVGVAIGLWAAGSSRILVLMALIPAAAMGSTLLERRTGQHTGARPRRA